MPILVQAALQTAAGTFGQLAGLYQWLDLLLTSPTRRKFLVTIVGGGRPLRDVDTSGSTIVLSDTLFILPPSAGPMSLLPAIATGELAEFCQQHYQDPFTSLNPTGAITECNSYPSSPALPLRESPASFPFCRSENNLATINDAGGAPIDISRQPTPVDIAIRPVFVDMMGTKCDPCGGSGCVVQSKRTREVRGDYEIYLFSLVNCLRLRSQICGVYRSSWIFTRSYGHAILACLALGILRIYQKGRQSAHGIRTADHQASPNVAGPPQHEQGQGVLQPLLFVETDVAS
ncbi:hypothetical protein V8B97DRAFT_1919521 [Scleroderma yunnanense]